MHILNNQIFLFFYGLAHQSTFWDWFWKYSAESFPNVVILLAGFFLLYHHEVLPYKRPNGDKNFADSIKIFKQKWREIVLVFFSGIFAWLISQGLKLLFHTKRPAMVLENITPLINKTDFAFPSGHATFFMALGVAIFLSHRQAGYAYIFFALLIGVARIVVGVHFPGDVLGGFALGAIIAWLVRFTYDKIYKKI